MNLSKKLLSVALISSVFVINNDVSAMRRSRSVSVHEEDNQVVQIPGRSLNEQEQKVEDFFDATKERMHMIRSVEDAEALRVSVSDFAKKNKKHIRPGRIDEVMSALDAIVKDIEKESESSLGALSTATTGAASSTSTDVSGASTTAPVTKTQEEILIDAVTQADNQHIALQNALQVATDKAKNIQASLQALQNTYKQYRSQEKASKDLIANADLMKAVAVQQVENNKEIQKLHEQISKAFAHYIHCVQVLDAHRRDNVNRAEDQVLGAMGFSARKTLWTRVRGLVRRY